MWRPAPERMPGLRTFVFAVVGIPGCRVDFPRRYHYGSIMKSLQGASDSSASPGRCADEVLTGVPAAMRYIRQEMRDHRGAPLSVPQFRALIFANVHAGPSLSALAEHLGLSLPTASRLADQLVRRGLLQRQRAASDRRRVSLTLTARGDRVYQVARRATRAALARRFAELSEAERRTMRRAMCILERLFTPSRSDESTKPARPVKSEMIS